MYTATATYEIEPQGSIRLKRPDGPMTYRTQINGLSVDVTLVGNGGARRKEAHEQYQVRLVGSIRIIASGQVEQAPPPVLKTEHGRDHTRRAAWFHQFEEQYHQTALTAANRVLRFFKYEKHSKMLHELTMTDIKTSLKGWSDEDGQDLTPSATKYFVAYVIEEASLGETDFTLDDDSHLQQALGTEMPIGAWQEFMSDAQTSIISGKMQRAVLEMAVACETAVKQAFFVKGTAASALFEYLEDKSQAHVRIVELVDGPAKEAFGESFREAKPQTYQDIEYLFQCRNKVAHRGVACYRDKHGVKKNATRKILEQWWSSALAMIEWLRLRSAGEAGSC